MSKVRRLVAFAIQGPANRSMMLVSAARFAARSGRQLVLCWNKDLFREAVDDGKTLHTEAWFPGPFNYEDFIDDPVPQMTREQVAGLDSWFGSGHENAPEWNRYIYEYNDPRPDLVVSGWKVFHDQSEPDLEWIETATPAQRVILDEILRFLPIITPNYKIRAAADAEAWKLGITRQTLGIQIRRQHYHAGLTTVEKYRELAGQMVGNFHNVFVCSDHPETEAAFVAWLRGIGCRAYCRKRDGRGLWERTAQGDGLIDLLCLSYCGTLIGSAGSAFSEQAWLMGGARDGAIKYVHPL